MTRRATPELLRARCRLLFFLVLVLLMLLVGGRLSAAIAAAGLVGALLSLRVATALGPSLGLTFVAIDWLALGLAIAFAGGVRSWSAVAIPVLVLVEVIPGGRQDWLYRLAPAMAMLAVLLIVDPHLGGHRAAGVVVTAAWVGAGALPAHLLSCTPRRRNRRRRSHVPAVDVSTGFSGVNRVAPMLTAALGEAMAEHAPLNVVCVRLDHFADIRTFLGERRAEAAVAEVARRLRRRLSRRDLAFRVSPDTLLLALRERLPGQARAEVAAMRHDIAARLVEGQRMTISTGISSYPAIRDLEGLLREARHDVLQADLDLPSAVSQ